MQKYRMYSLLFLTCGIGCFVRFPGCHGLTHEMNEEKQMISDVNLVFTSDSLGRIFVQEAYSSTNYFEGGTAFFESISPTKTAGFRLERPANGETERYVFSIFDPTATSHVFRISQPHASVRGISPMWFSASIGDIIVVHCSTDTHFDSLYVLLPECRGGVITCNLLYMTPPILDTDVNHFYIQRDSIQLSSSGVLTFTVFCSSQSHKSSRTTQVSIPLFWHPFPKGAGQEAIL